MEDLVEKADVILNVWRMTDHRKVFSKDVSAVS